MFQIDFKNRKTAATRRVETSMKEGYKYVITRIEFRKGVRSVENIMQKSLFALFTRMDAT